MNTVNNSCTWKPPRQRYGNYYGGGGYGGASSYGGNYGGSRPGWATSTQSPSYSSPYQLYGQHQGFGNYGGHLFNIKIYSLFVKIY